MSRRPAAEGDDNLGQRIRLARLKMNMTQVELATRVGYSRQHIAGLENGKRTNISMDLAKRLAEELNVAMEALLPPAPPEIRPPRLPRPDYVAFHAEIRALLDTAMLLGSSPAEVRVARELLESLHRQRAITPAPKDPT